MALKTNLIAYWAMNETSGNRSDSHNSNTLTDISTVDSETGFLGAKAAHFAPTTDRLEIDPVPAAMVLGAGKTFTCSCWVKLDNPAGSYGTFAGVYNSTGDHRCWAFDSGLNGATFRFVYSSNGIAVAALTSTLATVHSTWYFVAVYYDGSNLKIRVNDTVDSFGWSDDFFAESTVPFQVGVVSNSANRLDGTVDELAFWSRALVSDELDEIYNSGAGLPFSEWDVIDVPIVSTGTLAFAGLSPSLDKTHSLESLVSSSWTVQEPAVYLCTDIEQDNDLLWGEIAQMRIFVDTPTANYLQYKEQRQNCRFRQVHH